MFAISPAFLVHFASAVFPRNTETHESGLNGCELTPTGLKKEEGGGGRRSLRMRTVWQDEAMRVGSWKKDLGLDGVCENMVGTLHTNRLSRLF